MVKAIQKNSKYYIPAGIFWGLSLYCYAILWIFVPLFLFFIFLYELRYKILKINRFLVAGVLLLGTIGVPLVWFFFLNKGILPEICTEFFSIPQMDSMRAAEVSIREFPENIKNLIKVLLFQKDSMLHNSPSVGIYYYCSIPFMVIGGLTALYQFICNWKNKELKTADIMILWCLAAGIVGGLIHEVNVNRINCIHLVVIYFSAYGCSLCVKVSTQKFANNHIVKNILSSIIAGIYIVSFGFFYKEYYYDRTTDFYYGYEDALDYAESITEGKIGTVLIRYPLLFMHSEMLPSEYVEELGYIKNYDTIDEIGRYVIEPKPEEMKSDIVYVVPKYLEEEYLSEGYISVFDNERYVVIQSSF